MWVFLPLTLSLLCGGLIVWQNAWRKHLKQEVMLLQRNVGSTGLGSLISTHVGLGYVQIVCAILTVWLAVLSPYVIALHFDPKLQVFLNIRIVSVSPFVSQSSFLTASTTQPWFLIMLIAQVIFGHFKVQPLIWFKFIPSGESAAAAYRGPIMHSWTLLFLHNSMSLGLNFAALCNIVYCNSVLLKDVPRNCYAVSKQDMCCNIIQCEWGRYQRRDKNTTAKQVSRYARLGASLWKATQKMIRKHYYICQPNITSVNKT